MSSSPLLTEQIDHLVIGGVLVEEKLVSFTESNESMEKRDDDDFEKGKKKVRRVYRSDFKILKFLGKGTFGKVYQVESTNGDGRIFAMKAVKKGEIVGSETDIRHTRTERDVLTKTDHPFLVKLFYAFETKTRVYLIQEFLRGGELFRRIEKETMFLEDTAKFYLSEILLALEYLHGLDIIYRDLKSENVLLNYDGHIKLIDFGLSKMNMNGDVLTKTFCGTVEYMAPEVVARVGHGKAADWWSFGTFAFDILTGYTPFHSENRQKLFEKIRRNVVNFPAFMTPDSKDLIRKLLRKNPQKRLGSAEGATEIKNHRFFCDMDWDSVYNREYIPPYTPSAISDSDVSEFDDKFTSRSPRESISALNDEEDGTTPDPVDRLFEDFTYVAESQLDESHDDEPGENGEGVEDDDDKAASLEKQEPESQSDVVVRLHRGHGP